MKKLRVVQLGIDHDHALVTAKSLQRLSDIFELVGFSRCGSKRDTGDTFSAIPEYTPEELLSLPDIDAAIIETYELDLTRYAKMALERGLHVQMDKPGCANAEEFDAMVDYAEEHNLTFCTGYMYRYNPLVIELKQKIKSGELGDIISVEAHMDCLHMPEKRQWLKDFPGGMMFFLGCHLVDLIYSIKGTPEKVIPYNRCTGANGVTADDYGFVLFEYDTGISFAKTNAMEPGGFMRRQLVVTGTKGTYEIKPLEFYEPGLVDDFMFSQKCETYVDKNGGAPWGDHRPWVKSEMFNRYDNMLRSFAAIVRGEIENPYPYEYEKKLHRLVLSACGVDVDYK